MLPLFLYPLAFLGLLGVPALVAIYLLRNRFTRHPVSSLMLWVDTRESREGGRRWRRLQTPLLFALELLAILLLVFSATEPQVRLSAGTRPLIVVLDDSFSMRAGDGTSARERGGAALKEMLEAQFPYSVRFILAGERPQLLGEPVKSAREALALLDGWRCRQPAGRLDEALALAAELGGDLSLLLVVTDHKPVVDIPANGRLRWASYGTPRPNVAFVNAARTARDGLDRCMLEIANLDDRAAGVGLVIETLDGKTTLRKTTLTLPAGDTQRMILQFPDRTPAVRCRLDDATLPMDSEVILVPPAEPTVKVDVRIRDRRVRDPINKAVTASRIAVMSEDKPDLVISDRAEEADAKETWTWFLRAESSATAYGGPFVLDRTHPLTEGLSLRSVIWGAGTDAKADGSPVIMAGNIPLVTDIESNRANGAVRHEIRMRYNPALSNVQDSADWPILVWNVLNMRSAAMPGLTRVNLRLGDETVLNLAENRDKITLAPPGGLAKDLPVKGRSVSLRGDEVGLFTATAAGADFSFAVNALNKDESDLRLASTGSWGNWLDETSIRMEFSGVSSWLLLLLLAIVVVHLVLMYRGKKA